MSLFFSRPPGTAWVYAFVHRFTEQAAESQ